MSLKKFPITLFASICLAIVWAFSWIVTYDDLRGFLSLHLLTPSIEMLSLWGDYYARNAYDQVWYIGGGVSILLALLLVTQQHALFLVGFLSAVGGQLLFLYRMESYGLAAYSVAFIILCLYLRREPSTHKIFYTKEEAKPFGWGEGAVLLVIVSAAALYRYYALNQVFNYFEGELSPYSAGATSLHGMAIANKGLEGPWAPLGLLYYPPISLATHLFGTTLLSVRVSSAIVGVLTVPLLYLLLRRVSGVFAAQVGATLFSLNSLHIGWSRTDVHPHGVTTWPTLLLCWTMIMAFSERKAIYFFLLAFFTGLTWHQYPSGQSAVAIPIFVAALYFILHRGALPGGKKTVVWLALGVALWLIGLPLSYYFADGEVIFLNPFTLTTQRTSWGNTTETMNVFDSIFFVAATTGRHLLDVFQGFFTRAPYLFHQDFVPEIPGFYYRTVPWGLLPFAVFGLMMLLKHIRRVESLTIFAWLVVGTLPGILSEHAYPKRLSTVFPAIDCLAAIGVAWMLKEVAARTGGLRRGFTYAVFLLLFVSYASFVSSAWFSGRQWKYGVPPEIPVHQEIAKLIKPNTIIIAELWKGYDQGKSLLLLLDALSAPANRPNLLLLSRPEHQNLLELIDHPQLAQQELQLRPNAWWYNWTKLRDQREESLQATGWSSVLYIIQEREAEPNRADASAEIAKAKASCKNPEVFRYPSSESFAIPYVVIRCPLADTESKR